MVSFIKKVIGFLTSIRNRNPYYSWFIYRKSRERLLRGIILPYYTNVKSQTNTIVVCPYEGKLEGGGLADRFRGILSTYYVCKSLGLTFKLHYVHPFNLQDFLVPNTYDWTLGKEEFTYNIPHKSVLVLDSTQDNSFQKNKQKQWLYHKLGNCQGQTHVYTNSSFAYEHGYHQLFNELFKPTTRLETSINNQLKAIGGKYVSISCRFLNLFEDFNETHGYKKSLTSGEKEELLSKLLAQIEKLHQRLQDMKILVNSDSTTFLNYISSHTDYTYVIPGHITHIDNKTSDGGYEQYEKTFLDFFMIAHAEKIYVLKTGRMHISGYPYAASFVYGKPFEVVRF